LLKAFYNRRDCHWPAFRSGGRCVARFSKENCSSATYLPDFKTNEIAPCRFSKALCATLRHLLTNRSKGFELADFENLSAKLKAIGAKRLSTY
jgi:hypothetical protein